MCQAFAAEQRAVMSMEKNARAAGFKAFQEGKTRADVPTGPLDFPESWLVGFYLAEDGSELF